MIYIVPSRGRPQSVGELIEAWDATRVFAELFIAIDVDDPKADEYLKALRFVPSWVKHGTADTHSMVESLNVWSRHLASTWKHRVIGFMGDDHRPRTYAWDTAVNAACVNAVVYCDDRLQGRNLPTEVAIPAAWVRALNGMAPEGLRHLYVDNYWKTLGERTKLEYLWNIVIEHMHPVAGKAEWDEGYKRVNGGDVYSHDEAFFSKYLQESMDADVQKVLRCR